MYFPDTLNDAMKLAEEAENLQFRNKIAPQNAHWRNPPAAYRGNTPARPSPKYDPMDIDRISVMAKYPHLWCDTCGGQGHTSERCPNIIGQISAGSNGPRPGRTTSGAFSRGGKTP